MHSACKKPAVALLPLDMTLGLAVYTDTQLQPGVRFISTHQRQHHRERHLSGGILSAPLLQAARQAPCILEWVTFNYFLCDDDSRIPVYSLTVHGEDEREKKVWQ